MTMSLAPGDPVAVGPYRLVGRLGEGGQGVVYLGEAANGARVAVKVLKSGFGGDEAARERFLREARLARQVAQFCTARVLDVGVDAGVTYVVSEVVAGRSLDAEIRERGAFAEDEWHRLAVGTAAALTAIHRAGIVHRDFKPANVLLGPDGPRVIDFGIARAADTTTVTGEVMGTPAFMAPEQVTGGRVGPAADVFSWAVTMYFAATGRRPFDGDSLPEIFYRLLNTTPELDAFPAAFRGTAARCLAKEPGGRPTSAQLVMALLGHEAAEHAPAATHSSGRVLDPVPGWEPPSVVPVPGPSSVALLTAAVERARPRRRRTWPWVAAGCAVAVAAAAVVVALARGEDPVPFGRTVREPVLVAAAGIFDLAVTELDGRKVVVSAAHDGKVHVTELGGGKEIRTIGGHTDRVDAVAVSTVGGRPVVVSGGYDQTVRVSDLATGAELHAPCTAGGRVFSVAVAPLGGRTAAIYGSFDGKVQACDVETGAVIGRPVAASAYQVLSVAVAEVGGRTVAMTGGQDYAVHMVDPLAGQAVEPVFAGSQDTVGGLAVATIGGARRLVAAGWDKDLRIWDLATRQPVGRPLTGHTDRATAVTSARIGGRDLIVSGGDDDTVRVWDASAGAQIGEAFRGHGDNVDAVAVTELDGRPVVVSGGGDGKLFVWSLGTLGKG